MSSFQKKNSTPFYFNEIKFPFYSFAPLCYNNIIPFYSVQENHFYCISYILNPTTSLGALHFLLCQLSTYTYILTSNGLPTIQHNTAPCQPKSLLR